MGYWEARAIFVELASGGSRDIVGRSSEPFIATNEGEIIPFILPPDENYSSTAYVADINNSRDLAVFTFNFSNIHPSLDSELSYHVSSEQTINIGEILNSDTNRVYSINDLGQIVGVDRNSRMAFLYGNGTVTNLGTLPGGAYSSAYEINNQGQILGVSDSSSGSRAFLYSDGVMQDIIDARLESIYYPFNLDINNLGQIVVTSKDNEPFLYENGTLTNLNDLLNPESIPDDFTLTAARGINDRGQIIAQGKVLGENHGYLLNPTFLPIAGDSYINIGNISTYGDSVLLEGGEISLLGETVTTRGGSLTFDGVTTVDSSSDFLTLNSSVNEDDTVGGDITFTDTLDSVSAGSQNLIIKSGKGNLLFEQAVGSNNPFLDFKVDGANTVTANGDIISDRLIRINSKEDLTAQNITSNNGKVKLTSEQKSITTLDITSGSEDGDNIILRAFEEVNTVNLNAHELGKIEIISGEILEDESIVVGNVVTGSIEGKKLNVLGTGSFNTTDDITAYDGKVKITTLGDIITNNITANNGNVRLTSEQKSITTQDITTGIEGGNIILEALEGVTTANLNAYELGKVNIKSGEVGEDDSVIVGDILTGSITGKKLNVLGTDSFTATGDIIAHDGKVKITTLGDILYQILLNML